MEIYISRKTVYVIYIRQWCNKFGQARESTKDLVYPEPAHITASEENVRQVEFLC